MRLSIRAIILMSVFFAIATGCQSAQTIKKKDKKEVTLEKLDGERSKEIASKEETIVIDLHEMMNREKEGRAPVFSLNDPNYFSKEENGTQHWMGEALGFESNRYWSRIETSPGKPLQFFFIEKGLSSQWVDRIPKYEYYKLSTLTPYQVFFAATNEQGELERFYTQKEAFQWFFVDIRNKVPVFHESEKTRVKIHQIYLDKNTAWKDLKASHKRVLSQFLNDAKRELNKEAVEMLQKGEVIAHYQSLYLNDIEVRSALIDVSARYKDQLLKYKPDRPTQWR